MCTGRYVQVRAWLVVRHNGEYGLLKVTPPLAEGTNYRQYIQVRRGVVCLWARNFAGVVGKPGDHAAIEPPHTPVARHTRHTPWCSEPTDPAVTELEPTPKLF